jgi:signal transduction histidine kinase
VRKLQKSRENRVQAYDMDVCKVLVGVQEEYATIPGKTVMLNLNGQAQCRVRADDLLHDVFSNLVGNAVKHTGDRTQVSIDLDTVRENGRDYCRVMVEDNGPGIPDEFKKMLFTRSLKGTSRAKGMGLGLYIVKTLVENYEGRVWAEDRVPGDHMKGARFVVMLPVVE